MNSNYFLTKDICTISIAPDDLLDHDIGLKFINLIQKEKQKNVIFDLKQFEIITSEDIEYIERIIKMFKLNHIDVVVCNINIYTASILFHFIDNISFKTALNIESAIDVFKSK